MKDIKGYEGLYAVTSCGKVWSYRSQKFLKPNYNNWGYHMIRLYKNGICKTYYLHRLVAEAYIPNPNNLPEVNHIDEVKEHNYIRNLSWCTHQYNMNYSIEKHYKRVKCVETGKIFKSGKDAARTMSTTVGNISNALRGYSKTAKGYHWEFI